MNIYIFYLVRFFFVFCLFGFTCYATYIIGVVIKHFCIERDEVDETDVKTIPKNPKKENNTTARV